jgi:hypothetical protein
MANYPLNRTVFNRSDYEKTIDTSFSQISSPTLPIEDTITIPEFFNLYDSLFYDIPVSGSINSHQYLVEQSGEYIGAEAIAEDIQALLDEITSLRQELLVANQQLLGFQLSSSLSPST